MAPARILARQAMASPRAARAAAERHEIFAARDDARSRGGNAAYRENRHDGATLSLSYLPALLGASRKPLIIYGNDRRKPETPSVAAHKPVMADI